MTPDPKGPAPFVEQAAAVQLRAKPRPVSRINKKVVIAASGIGALLLAGAASVALHPPKLANDNQKELYNTKSKPTAEALANLPESYADVTQPIPSLGSPLPGDFGATVLAAQKALGVEVEDVYADEAPFSPKPDEDAERAERIRVAKLAQESLQSSVFFQLTGARLDPTANGEGGVERRPTSELTALDFRDWQTSSSGPEIGSDPNLQASKAGFLGASNAKPTRNSHTLERPSSPFLVMAGTIIPASLITGLNSDLPGTIVAQVTAPVFDTATGAHLLVPQGSRLIGRYDSRVSFGQDRALIVWDRLILPNGASIQLDSLPGADAKGYAGLADRVDHHWGRLLLASGLATLLGVSAELGDNSDSDLIDALRDGGQESIARITQRIVDRNLDIQPTLRVRPGWPLRVIVTRDLALPPQ